MERQDPEQKFFQNFLKMTLDNGCRLYYHNTVG